MKRIAAIVSGALLISSLSYIPLKAEEESDLRILFTTDLNDHIDRYRTVSEDGSTIETGGYAYLYRLIQNERTENTILVDNGNFSIGTYYDSLNETDAPDLNLLTMMGYDAAALGEEEFSRGASALTNMLTKTEEPVSLLCANLQYGSTKVAENLKEAYELVNGSAWKIVDKGDIQVGILAVTGADDTTDISFADPVETVKETVETLQKNGADYIIVLVSGTGMSEKIASDTTGVDLIVTSQEEDMDLTQPVSVNGTQIVSAGENGRYLGEIDVNTDGTVVNYQLLETGSDADSTISNAIKNYKTTVNRKVFTPYGVSADTAIATNSYQFTSVDERYDEFLDNNTADLITDAYAYAYSTWYESWYEAWSQDKQARLLAAIEEAESTQEETEEEEETEEDPTVTAIRSEQPGILSSAIGIEARSQFTGTFYPGKITAGDAYNVIAEQSRLSSLGLVFIKGSDLRQLAEFDVTYGRKTDPDKQLYFSGMKYEYSDYREDYSHVEEVYVDAVQGYYVPVKDDTYYPVVTTVYILNRMTEIENMTDGKLSISMYDEDGNPISSISQTVLYTDNNREYKNYTALIRYLSQMERTGASLPAIPENYAKAENRKILDKSFNLISWIRHMSTERMIQIEKIVIWILAVLIGYRIIRKIINRMFIK